MGERVPPVVIVLLGLAFALTAGEREGTSSITS